MKKPKIVNVGAPKNTPETIQAKPAVLEDREVRSGHVWPCDHTFSSDRGVFVPATREERLAKALPPPPEPNPVEFAMNKRRLKRSSKRHYLNSRAA